MAPSDRAKVPAFTRLWLCFDPGISSRSRVVAEDANKPLPFEHRVDQVTVEERDGVDVRQPRVRLDVEVGLSGQRRDDQDLVELGQPALGLR
jgi:hypothetical protein